MKILKLIPIFVCILAVSLMQAQKLTPKQQKAEDNKVQIFTSEERDNLQLHFHEKVKEMKLTEKLEEEYFSNILYYTFKMGRLNDKDVNLTDEEMKTELEKLVGKMNTKIKTILPEDKYEMHVSNFNELLNSVYRRNNWTSKVD